MHQTMSRYDFHRAFETSEERRNTFSYAALDALYDYLEDYGDSTGQPYEFDMIALCCEFTEYNTFDEFVRDYGTDYGATWDELQDHTTVIPIPNTDGAIVGEF